MTPITEGPYKGFYQLGRNPNEMSWARVSDAVIEFRPEGILMGEDPNGASLRKRGLPTVTAAYGAIDAVDVRRLGTPLRSLSAILGLLLVVVVASIGRGLSRTGQSASALADLELFSGFGLFIVGMFLVFLGGLAYAATQKWVVLTLTSYSGQQVAAAIQLKKVRPEDVATAIEIRRFSRDAPSA